MSHLFNAEDLGELFIEEGTLKRGVAFMLSDITISTGCSGQRLKVFKHCLTASWEKTHSPRVNTFKKFCGLDMNDIIFHFFCADCMALLAKARTAGTESAVLCAMGRDLVRSSSFFVSLEEQLSSLLSSKTTSNAAMDTLEFAPGCTMHDITDD